MLPLMLVVFAALGMSGLHCMTVHPAACSSSQEGEAVELWKTAAATEACVLYTSGVGSSVSIVWPCDDSACTRVMRQLGTDLPQCLKPDSTISEKISVLASVLMCDASSQGEGNSTDYCTLAQMVSIGDQFLQLVIGDECTASKIVSVNDVIVNTPCSSPCAADVEAFTKQLYNCEEQVRWKRVIERSLEDCKTNPGSDIVVASNFGSYIRDSKYYPVDVPTNPPSSVSLVSLSRVWVVAAMAAAWASAFC